MRGDIYRLKPATRRGHQQSGARYAVVLQSDDLHLLSTVLVAPTSTSARPAVFRPEIVIGSTPTRVLLEQTTAVDPSTEFGKFAGRISASERAEIDTMLTHVLGLI
ncbi:MAG: type II toxin-antitoxin system PemK/MazF family toxin [Bifidobacteriaceae bacterium]|nr:type II toxin-antitoxin system PemK/MazF family toxin [Bifidobacteriaceae bacterium]